MISIIFGAGASYGSGGCSPQNPPLGNDLFSELEGLSGVFNSLSEKSKGVFKKDGFEAGMATIADDSRIINPLQKELACHLSGLSVKADNAYVRLFNKLQSCIDKVNIITLNYDLLIEQALQRYSLIPDYNANKNGVSLLKPHGSCNFLPQLPEGMTLSGNTMLGCGTFIEGLATQAATTKDEITTWCNDPRNSDLSPVLAMYAEGKRVVINRNLISNTQQKFSDAIASSKLVVLVGIKYIPHDIHIWEPIEKAQPELFIVDPYPQSTINWANSKELSALTIAEKGFDKAVWDITKAVHKVAYSN